MGPYIVPLEFMPNYGNIRVTTRVNGEIMQDSDTSYLIHDVERILRYATDKMTFWPGDVIATGTPSGVGNGRDPAGLPEAGRCRRDRSRGYRDAYHADRIAVDVDKVAALPTAPTG